MTSKEVVVAVQETQFEPDKRQMTWIFEMLGVVLSPYLCDLQRPKVGFLGK